MFQEPLIGDEAVLFVSQENKDTGFWNKNVMFPIDVAFFDENKYLINIATLEREELVSVYANRPYRYVIETRLNWFRDNNIKQGTNMDLLISDSLTKLGFKKISKYDPIATHQSKDTHSTYTKIKSIPTPQAIDMLSKEWLDRKPPNEYAKVKKYKNDLKEIRR